MQIDLNPEIQKAFDFVTTTRANLFLTGKAGTGKTTFLRELRTRLHKRNIVLAPTGVAAINAEGMTLHSFFQLSFGAYIPGQFYARERSGQYNHRFSKNKIRIIESLELLIIDEISMVRADVLDAVSDTLQRYRKNKLPFGGVQLLMIGDVHQLAPVATDEDMMLLKDHYESLYFFHSKALSATTYLTIELNKIYRQSDSHFTALLNAIRDNRAAKNVFDELNKRYIPGFAPHREEEYIRLTTHVHAAARINRSRLDELPGTPYTYTAVVTGDFPEQNFPNDRELILKQGAQVMFIRNDKTPEKRYYNGKIGTVILLDEKQIVVKCKDGDPIRVEKEIWENTRYILNESTKVIEEHTEGTFQQYPVKTAWAITIHKSQGLTFEKAIIDSGSAFAHGQVYVALSRCKSLDGLVLSSPLRPETIISDYRVDRFVAQTEQERPDHETLAHCQKDYYAELLFQMIDFSGIRVLLFNTLELFRTHLQKTFPRYTGELADFCTAFNKEVCEISLVFKAKLKHLIENTPEYRNDPVLAERISSGSAYFMEKLERCEELAGEFAGLDIDNQSVRLLVRENAGELRNQLFIKRSVLQTAETGFSVEAYSKSYFEASLTELSDPRKKGASSKTVSAESADIVNPELFKALIAWRKEKAEESHVAAFQIVHQKVLIGIQATLPVTIRELRKIKGMGDKNIAKYGDELLAIVRDYTPQEMLWKKQSRSSEPDATEQSPKAEKPEKEPPYLPTFRLFTEGKTIPEIARERERSIATIETHLAACLKYGLLEPSALLSDEKYESIRNYIAQNGKQGLTEIKNGLTIQVDYSDIKYVLSYMESGRK